MIKTIRINQYKKLKNISLNFEGGLNAISGENGTCKSSLLYLVGNSFQAVNGKCEWIKDKKALDVIKIVNDVTNPKVEALQRGDKQYNDPAHGVTGTLYSIDYYDWPSLDFRRHNTRNGDSNRYALKPPYKSGKREALPFCPVIYLGLSRLVPYGEFRNENAITTIKKTLPNTYLEGVTSNFKMFTHLDIKPDTLQQMGDIKTRSEFSSSEEGIDSNTISAGEDNLYIILSAVETLKMYYESIQRDDNKDIVSVLLVDELDATLHPSYQIKLLNLLRDYAYKYKIQIVFTTHSLSTIKHLLDCKDNVIYLIDNETDVLQLENPTIQQIEAHLYNVIEDDIYKDRCIPVFTEDAETRYILSLLFDYLCDIHPGFPNVKRFFQVPDISISGDTLHSLFKDEKLIRAHVGAFCVLDGDKNPNYTECVITLPGKNYFERSQGLSPEKLIYRYGLHLYSSDDEFWRNQTILKAGIRKKNFQDRIIETVTEYEKKVENKQTNEPEREFYKKMFGSNKAIFTYIFKHWLHDPQNQESINKFYNDLQVMFTKCCDIRGISAFEWK